MTTWTERVKAELKRIRDQAKTDDDTFLRLCSELDTEDARRQGERLDIGEGWASKILEGTIVFSISVGNGQIRVDAKGDKQFFTEDELALTAMAKLMANEKDKPTEASDDPPKPQIKTSGAL